MTLRILCFLTAASLASILSAETPPEEAAAIKQLGGMASNIQKNRDGTVRFVRFSKALVRDKHVALIQAFTKLDYLAVVCPSVTDAGLACLDRLQNLDTLFLSGSGITDKTMVRIKQLERLEHLYLDQLPISDSGLAQLASLTNLKTLSLCDTQVTDSGLAHLTKLTQLETLRLDGCQITGRAFEPLSSLANLRHLTVDHTPLEGIALKHIAELSKLKTLSLSGTQVSSTDLSALSDCQSLSDLLLYDTPLTSNELRSLQSALPKLRICLEPHAAPQNAYQRFLAGQELRKPVSESKERAAAQLLPVARPARERFLQADAAADFQRHVIPLLGRLGCNGRACHGSFQGQGGFRLSMFGYNFTADHEAISERIHIEQPGESLLLRKPTMQEEHEGGLRFETDGWEHRLLQQWITGGAPAPKQPHQLVRYEVIPETIEFSEPGQTVQLQAIAVWSDGYREDVTCLSRFETKNDAIAEINADGLVTGVAAGDTYVIAYYDKAVGSTQVLMPVAPPITSPDGSWTNRSQIDKFVKHKLDRLGIVPAPLTSDSQFLRRISLDLIGTLPTPNEVQAFVADEAPDKRERKVEELLESPAYAEWWAVKLCDLTGSNSQYLGTTDMNSPAAGQWNAWVRDRLRRNVGWHKIAAGIILARSRRPDQTYAQYAAEQSRMLSNKHSEEFTDADNPMHYYWFRSNNQTAEDRALSFGYVFLGVRLQCAQCHKHPFDQWSQQDFQKFSQFFTRVKAGIAPEFRDAQLELKTRLGVPVKLDTAALRRQMYMRVAAEGLPIPWNEIWIDRPGAKPTPAKLLGDAEFDLNTFDDPREPLMAWLLQPDNPYFAPSFVNRVWAQYFGLGIVDPPDDFNLANPPSHKGLLEWLSREFVNHDYDIKWLHRTIANSRTYQLSFEPNATNQYDERNYSRARIRRLPAEVTIDAILQATANRAQNDAWSQQVNNRKIGQHPRSIQARGIDYSLLVFGKPLRTTNCDCERQMNPTLLQSLYVRNDHEMIGWLERSDGWLAELAARLGVPLESEIQPGKTITAKPAKPKTDQAPPQLKELIRLAYLRTLAREPSVSELERAMKHQHQFENPIEGLRDLTWALLNTQEFLTNH